MGKFATTSNGQLTKLQLNFNETEKNIFVNLSLVTILQK